MEKLTFLLLMKRACPNSYHVNQRQQSTIETLRAEEISKVAD